MENKQERVLAYQASKVIEKKDLSSVSGGIHLSQYSTTTATGSSGSGVDACMDVTLDW